MSNHKRETGFNLRSAVIQFSVLCASGLLFVTTANSNTASQPGRHDVDLPTLVRHKEGEIDVLAKEVSDYEEEVKQLTAETNRLNNGLVLNPPVGFQGPGISVALSDAPYTESLPQGASADDLVIHQGDIESVFNAMWAGGAEVVGIQGIEVKPDTMVRCVGNVININGELHSPPFVITAIGNPQKLLNSLDKDDSIRVFQQYVNRYHLGFQVQESSDIVIKRFKTKTDYDFVKVLNNDSTPR
ncbi:DUF881 domain-containing protein [Gleimia coleocanis]|uniref:DUF881 domain-containing protein n=1 Tax=Gleimia coleocanis TaxID=103618 RepID=UPI00031563AA|nr:DUF881 domain-containing protein [Gleimia coleocanis]